MDKDKLKFTSWFAGFAGVQRSVMELLFDFPTTVFSEREMARQLDVSPTAIAKAVRRLEEAGLASVKKKFLLDIRLAAENEKVTEMKRVSNLGKLYSSGLVSFFSDNLPGATVVLFGSYACGEDTERSDIDLAVIGTEEKALKLESFEKTLRRRINVQFFGSRKIDKNLKENIINGITLKGHVTL